MSRLGLGGFVLQNHFLLPLRDLNPFDSILLILRRVGVGARVVRTLLPEFPLVGFRRWRSRPCVH